MFLLALGAHAISAAQARVIEPATVRIGVLGLFHPQVLVLQAARGSSLRITLDDGRELAVAEGESAVLRRQGERLQLEVGGAPASKFVSDSAVAITRGADRLSLEVPGKLKRTYRGSVRVSVAGGSLLPVIEMATETAVASIVQAESPPGAPLEALKAQAVATRSFLLAQRTGHVGFDACDTTHCQFLRSPAEEGSGAALGAAATRGLVLQWQGDAAGAAKMVAAMYSRSCGGNTRTLAQAGVAPRGEYPFYAVRCAFCLRHPERWQREQIGAAPTTERERIAYNRSHGWEAVPALPAEASHPGEISGRGTGHGVGMCQLGAADMAAHGKTFAEILAHFYPDTRLVQLAK